MKLFVVPRLVSSDDKVGGHGPIAEGSILSTSTHVQKANNTHKNAYEIIHVEPNK